MSQLTAFRWPGFRAASAWTTGLLVFLASPSPAAAGPDETGLRAGAAVIDITPAYPVRLTGFVARKAESEPGGFPLWAKALALDGGVEGPAVLMTVDNCGVGETVVERVAARLFKRAGIPRARITVASSHTHAGPQTLGFAANIFAQDLPPDQMAAIQRYTGELTEKLVQVALVAVADLKPARLFRTEGSVGFAANRRTPGGSVDHSLPVLCARDWDGNIRALVANYACHCTTVGAGFNRTCGDWAGFAAARIEQQFPGSVALITIGCGADANPHPRGGEDFGVGFAQMHGSALADAVTRLVAGGTMTSLTSAPNVRSRRIPLPFSRPFTRQEWEQRATRDGIVGYHARKHLARMSRGEAIPVELPYLVQTWTFGSDYALVFLGGEVVVDYALRLKRELDASRLWITAYANDVPCYIPSARILAEGGYEAEESLWYYDRPQRLAPETEDMIVATVRELLGEQFAPPTAKEMDRR